MDREDPGPLFFCRVEKAKKRTPPWGPGTRWVDGAAVRPLWPEPVGIAEAENLREP